LPASAERDDCGTLWLAADEGELDAARAKAKTFAAAGLRAEVLDPRQVQEAEPALRPGLAGALRVPDDMVCYPPAIARALMSDALRRGATLTERRVMAIEPGRVRCNDGTVFDAGAIVVASGAHAAELLPGLPLMPRRGHLVITDRTPLHLHHQVIELGYLHTAHTMGGASVAFNVQPRRTGQLLVGSSRELVGFDPKLNRALLARMLARAVEFVPGLARVPASRAWVGFRPATPDALPLIGAWPAMPGVWVATGHEGLGITMAPGTADLVVAAITGRAPPVDPLPYRPDRTMAQAAA
jgi:glycine/D-amino acid oxidase-like deaminating enzyme